MRMRFYAKVDRREAAEPAFNGTGTPRQHPDPQLGTLESATSILIAQVRFLERRQT
jgi:hypothetical protein